MSIFKNQNESAFVGGRKHWTDVIKNSGDGNLLIWRQPEEDFNTNSTLVVMPGEQAIFIKGGVIEQVFENGTYKLNTDNYPFISRLKNAFSGGVSTFSCVVYFIRTSQSMEILWGTSSPIQVRDKLLGIQTKIRARGSYKISIENPSVLLSKLVGNNVSFVSQQDLLDNYFANEFQSKIKSCLTKLLNNIQTELLGIESRIDEFSELLQPKLADIFDEYGVKLIKYSISAMDIDDDELRRRYDEIGIDAIEKMRIAQADKEKIRILGDDWGRQQAADILGNLANNPGAGGVAAAGAGMGMGIGAGGAFGSMAQQMFAPMNNGFSDKSQEAMSTGISGRFIQQDNGETKSSPDDPKQVLSKLKELLDAGLIEQSEYDSAKKDVFAKLLGEK